MSLKEVFWPTVNICDIACSPPSTYASLDLKCCSPTFPQTQTMLAHAWGLLAASGSGLCLHYGAIYGAPKQGTRRGEGIADIASRYPCKGVLINNTATITQDMHIPGRRSHNFRKHPSEALAPCTQRRHSRDHYSLYSARP
jgi:hypothetical protein